MTALTEYVDDTDGAQAAEMATDPSVGLIIMVRNDGTVKVVNRTGRPIEDIPSAGSPPQVPGQFKSSFIIYTKNPTCVRCLHGGAWKEICW